MMPVTAGKTAYPSGLGATRRKFWETTFDSWGGDYGMPAQDYTSQKSFILKATGKPPVLQA